MSQGESERSGPIEPVRPEDVTRWAHEEGLSLREGQDQILARTVNELASLWSGRPRTAFQDNVASALLRRQAVTDGEVDADVASRLAALQHKLECVTEVIRSIPTAKFERMPDSLYDEVVERTGYALSQDEWLRARDGGWHRLGTKVGENAVLAENAVLMHRAAVADQAVVKGNAILLGAAQVCENAVAEGHAILGSDCIISGFARVQNNAQIYGSAIVRGHALVGEDAEVRAKAHVSGEGVVCGSAVVKGVAQVRDGARVEGTAVLTEAAYVGGNHLLNDGEYSEPPFYTAGPLGPLFETSPTTLAIDLRIVGRRVRTMEGIWSHAGLILLAKDLDGARQELVDSGMPPDRISAYLRLMLPALPGTPLQQNGPRRRLLQNPRTENPS